MAGKCKADGEMRADKAEKWSPTQTDVLKAATQIPGTPGIS